jgi:hypothetical protein
MLKAIHLLVLVVALGARVALAQPATPELWTEDDRWEAIVTAFDAARLAKMPDTRAAALREAEAAPEFPQIAPLIDAPAQPGNIDQLLGNWRCRTIKIGGLLPLTIYSYFDCAILREGNELRLVKTSGSQRFTGTLYASALPGEFVYVGAANVGAEPPRAYNTNPDDNQIGVLRQLGPDHLLLELPKPIFESNHDWIELVR